MKPKELLGLLALTFGALLIHGYHPAAEDGEIYLPGIKKLLNPGLYPFGAEFFQSHARMTLFPHLIAWSARLLHLPFDLFVFLWHVASVFLLLLACWKLSGQCFAEPKARWGGVALVAALLTIPVAGTSLYILDQYLNPRSLSALGLLFAIAGTLDKRYVRAALWIAFTGAIHPLMAVFGLSYIFLLILLRDCRRVVKSAAFLLPFGLTLRRPSEAYLEVVQTRSYFFIFRWQWYEWIGIFAPLALLWWFSRIARRSRLPVVDLMSWALVIFGLFYFAVALALTIPGRFVGLTFLQPMRSLLIVYVLLFLMGGGFLGQRVLKDRVWRWFMLFVPLCVGMWYTQRQLFPADRHIEWPGVESKNSWLQAFEWIRLHTPHEAIFALDPEHMALPGEGQQGFRAVAERSMLADAVKDSGACTMFPQTLMAEHWREQVQAQSGWKHFRLEDFRRLKEKYGVTWVVLERPGIGLTCPYENDRLLVCRID